MLFNGGWVVESHFSCFWNSLGATGKGSGSLVRMEELVWEAFLGYLESCPNVFDDSRCTFEDLEGSRLIELRNINHFAG
jgi:hypothetical protein